MPDLSTYASRSLDVYFQSERANIDGQLTQRLVDAYRETGHYLANLDPLRLSPPRPSLDMLELSAFDLSEADLARTFFTRLAEPPRATLRKLISILRAATARSTTSSSPWARRR